MAKQELSSTLSKTGEEMIQNWIDGHMLVEIKYDPDEEHRKISTNLYVPLTDEVEVILAPEKSFEHVSAVDFMEEYAIDPTLN